MAADVGPPVHVGQASACAGLQSRWIGSMNAAAGGLKPRRRLKPAPHGTGGPTLARKCEVILAPALRCRPLIVAIETAGETACPTLLDQSFGEVGGAGGFACRWKLISIAHPNPENGYAPSERDGATL